MLLVLTGLGFILGLAQMVVMRGLPMLVGLLLQHVPWPVVTTDRGALIHVRRPLVDSGQLLVPMRRSQVSLPGAFHRILGALLRDDCRLKRGSLTGSKLFSALTQFRNPAFDPGRPFREILILGVFLAR
ncbi:hypothetical protein [Mycobacterium asiaticum]|uniref:Uncharacterized protein n=1 Tax=Mycobacterium asiaticum TaxID=1790 RepID=A0A1A3MW66_MYCAS|nr:hypothetical protein [Mycobacterium asiaticum]OBK13776.1 hypothetical protein A5635_11435 [Mycobacterium asiaticum]